MEVAVLLATLTKAFINQGILWLPQKGNNVRWMRSVIIPTQYPHYDFRPGKICRIQAC